MEPSWMLWTFWNWKVFARDLKDHADVGGLQMTLFHLPCKDRCAPRAHQSHTGHSTEVWATLSNQGKQLDICLSTLEKQFGMRPHWCSFSLKWEGRLHLDRGQTFSPMLSCRSLLSVQKTLLRISEEDRPEQEQKPQNLIEQRMCWVRGCGKTSSVIPVFFRKFLSPL